MKGDYWEIVPLCRIHHVEQGQIGIRTFEKKYRLDLDEIAERTEYLWQLSQILVEDGLHEE